MTSQAGEITIGHYTRQGKTAMEDEGNRSSSDTTCSLSLEYSSSSFEWSNYSDGASTEVDDVDGERGSSAVEPYQYEPEASESESLEEDSSSEENERRLGNTAHNVHNTQYAYHTVAWKVSIHLRSQM